MVIVYVQVVLRTIKIVYKNINIYKIGLLKVNKKIDICKLDCNYIEEGKLNI